MQRSSVMFLVALSLVVLVSALSYEAGLTERPPVRVVCPVEVVPTWKYKLCQNKEEFVYQAEDCHNDKEIASSELQ